MVYGELGRDPMELQMKIKKIWSKFVGNPVKLSGKIYRLLFKLFISGNRAMPCMNYTKSKFDETGLSNIWDGQNSLSLIF